jgi:hypothetical protein
VENPGRSVSETATVFASLSQRELDNATSCPGAERQPGSTVLCAE